MQDMQDFFFFYKNDNLNRGSWKVIKTSKSMSATCSHCKAHLQVHRVSRMSAAEWLRLLVLLHGLCWIGSLCLTTLLPGYMSRICAQLWPAEYTRFQPFSIETSCPLTALQYMQLRLLLRKGSLRLSTLWPRLNNALQNLTPRMRTISKAGIFEPGILWMVITPDAHSQTFEDWNLA